MTSTCWASVRGEVARFTQLNSCCAPENSACGAVVTDGFISVVITQEISAATVITVKNAADKICVYDPGCDSLLDLSVAISLCNVNPDLITLMTGQKKVLDFAGNAVGFERSTDLACDNRFSLEIWTDVPGTACAGTPPQKQWGYFLVPCLRSATITGAVTINGTNSVTVDLTAKTTVPNGWGTGPVNGGNPQTVYDVVPINATNTPGHLLAPVATNAHDHVQLTTIAPPAIPANCGCVAIANNP